MGVTRPHGTKCGPGGYIAPTALIVAARPRRAIDPRRVEGSDVKEYAAAVIWMLDRQDESVEAAYCYPITRIEFRRADASVQRSFVVDNGEWVEVGG